MNHLTLVVLLYFVLPSDNYVLINTEKYNDMNINIGAADKKEFSSMVRATPENNMRHFSPESGGGRVMKPPARRFKRSVLANGKCPWNQVWFYLRCITCTDYQTLTGDSC